MNTQLLFPTPIGIFDLNRALTEQELFFINNQDLKKNKGNKISVSSNVLAASEMSLLHTWLLGCISEYSEKIIKANSDVQLKITQSWFNYSEPGEWHHRHAHQNSYLSGVFYISTNPKDHIMFYSYKNQQIKIHPTEWNLYNAETWWLNAITGRLLLFPSSLEHSVPNVEGDKTRVSMSFNTFPVGLLGNMNDNNGLELPNTVK